MNIDLNAARAAISEYVAALQDPSRLSSTLNRTWMECLLLRHEVVPNASKFSIGESHAVWYACLLKTKQLNGVSRMEVSTRRSRGRTTETTVRRLLDPRSIQGRTITGMMLRELMKQ